MHTEILCYQGILIWHVALGYASPPVASGKGDDDGEPEGQTLPQDKLDWRLILLRGLFLTEAFSVVCGVVDIPKRDRHLWPLPSHSG